jgi:hypothetical protein
MAVLEDGEVRVLFEGAAPAEQKILDLSKEMIPHRSNNGIIEAEQREAVERLCAEMSLLPRAGVELHELKALGFDINESTNGDVDPMFHSVVFPEGWSFVPTWEPPFNNWRNSRTATVFDTDGVPRVGVYLADTKTGDYLAGKTTVYEY